MLRDITIGQYYPADSVIHKLDPRVKLVGTILFIISLFAFGSVSGYIVATVFLLSVIFLSKVPLKMILKGLKAIFILMLFTVAFNLFLTPGEVLVRIWKLTITREGLKMAVHMAVRLVYLVAGSSVMTLTTTPNNLTDGMEKGLGFLKKIHVPVHEIAMMMSIALRFIPILMEETDKIMKAQSARGADFESGNIIQKAKSQQDLSGSIQEALLHVLALSAGCRADGPGSGISGAGFVSGGDVPGQPVYKDLTVRMITDYDQ